MNKNVQEFIKNVEDDKRRQDSNELIKMMQNATGEEPYMWGTSIVGFGVYHYKYESGREGDTVMVGFSPRKAALVLYGIMDETMIQKLGECTTGKGCIYIKDLDKVKQEVLVNMIATAYKDKKVQTRNI